MIVVALVLSALAFVGSAVSVVVTLATSRRLDQARNARLAKRTRA